MNQGVCPICKNEDAQYELSGNRNVDRQLWAKTWSCGICGRFAIADLVLREIEENHEGHRHMITAAIRHNQTGNELVTIMSDEELRSLLETIPNRVSVLEQLDHLLALVAEKTTTFGESVGLTETDYPLVFAKSFGELRELAGAVGALGRVKRRDVKATGGYKLALTVAGWERVEELRERQPDSRRVFVAMSFRDDLTALYENGIKLGVEDSRYFQAFRVDSEQHNQKIDDKIVADIRRSALVVADVTHQSQGVYYEAGYAAGLGRQVIWMCRENEIEKAHFDTRQFNHILWNTPEEAREKLNDRIVATVLPADAVMGSR